MLNPTPSSGVPRKGQKTAGSGIQKGKSRIKHDKELARLVKIYGSPFEAMFVLARDSDDEQIKFKCNKELANYIKPKLRSVEVAADIATKGRSFVMNLTI